MANNRTVLQNIDLNLLMALHVLLETVNVTRAAEQLGVSQSAMSHTLRRLRELFGDPLLVRSRGGMVLTPRAEELRGPLLHGLQELDGVVRGNKRFDPRSSRAEFSIAATDFLQLLFVPQLVHLLSREAPDVQLRVWTPEFALLLPLLEAGELDFVIGSYTVVEVAERVHGIMRRELGREPMSCAVRGGHPEVSGRLTLDAFTALPHIQISLTGKGPGVVDELLAGLGRKRRIATRLSSFLMAPWVLAASDYILTAPRRSIETYQCGLDLQLLEPPLELSSIPIVLFWHERNHRDPANQWMREAITRAYSGAPRAPAERSRKKERPRAKRPPSG
ncbi:LysR family transcriptional regulator [Sorangium sp. So ce1078]|uniref:LysR family transcriptional regulator n=1 Tax=Sorangium sp. So ce1078 TaxID=3133329 RepID=UPI003F5D90B7